MALNDPPVNPRAPLPKLGAPFGERNGRYRHGRFSRVKLAERQAALDARSRDWMAQIPRWNWEAVVQEIRRDD